MVVSPARSALGVVVWLALALALGCGGGVAAPDLVLHHGKIFTADTTTPFVEALAIREGRIVRIGSDAEVLGSAGPETRRVDLEGRTVVPGFNDAHDHITPPMPGLSFVTGPDPLPDPPFAVVRDSLRSLVGRTPAGTWIHAFLGDRTLGDPLARRSALDRVAPDHPVALVAWTGHGVVLNSAALRAVGLSDSVSDPLGGRFGRDPSGRLDGLVEEYARYALWRRMTPGDSASLWDAYEARAREVVGWGITSVQSFTSGADPEVLATVLPGLDLPIRLRLIPLPFTSPTGRVVAPWLGLRSAGQVRVSGLKWVLDGTPVERLAAQREPYADRPGWYGRTNFSGDTLEAMLREALEQHRQPLIHAVGDSAIALLLHTMERLAPDSVWRAVRLRIEHGDGLYPDLIPLARRLGVGVVQNPSHLALGPMASARNGPARMAGYQPLRSLVEAGVPLALGSDGPLNPFLNLMLAVTHPDDPAEALTMEQAVRAYTWGSAWAEFEEERKGTLTPGRLADLAVLSQDIFTANPAALPAVTSVLTLVAGRPVHDAGGLLR